MPANISDLLFSAQQMTKHCISLCENIPQIGDKGIDDIIDELVNELNDLLKIL